jgi:hypothetical protein
MLSLSGVARDRTNTARKQLNAAYFFTARDGVGC